MSLILRKFTMKKFAVCMFAVAFSLAIVGCGEEAKKAPTPAKAPEGSKAAEPAKAAK
jgi:hypothetical protein